MSPKEHGSYEKVLVLVYGARKWWKFKTIFTLNKILFNKIGGFDRWSGGKGPRMTENCLRH